VGCIGVVPWTMSDQDPVNHPKHYTRHPTTRLKWNLEGKRFGKLTVLKRVVSIKRNVHWSCRCSCGGETVAITGNLLSGRHKSCGCSKYKKRAERTFTNGYAFVTADHPRASKNTGRIREHILVMEKFLGRYLFLNEEVHHINGNRADNRLRNLELWSCSHPAGARVKDLVSWAKEVLKTYSTW
jgi:hypothetical protein